MHRGNRSSNSRRHSARGATWALLACAALLQVIVGCATGIEGPEGPLRAPRLGRVTGSDGAIEISFKARSKADSYRVYWSASKDIKVGTGTLVDGVGPVFHLSGLTNGTQYYFIVQAVKAGQPSPDFLSARGTPLKEPSRDFPNFMAVMTQPGDTFDALAEYYLKDRTKGGIIQDFNNLDDLTPYTAVAIPKNSYEMGGLSPNGYQLVPVLTYHQFSANKANKMTVPLQQFEQEMQYLRDNGYHVIPLSQFIAFMDLKGQLPDKAVVITIDDGWQSFYDFGFPVLKKYGYPATLFVYTDFPESDPLALKWPEVKEMFANGVDVQCHTKSHRNLKMQKNEDLKSYLASLDQEFNVCKQVLKEKLGTEPKFLAYPYGANNHLAVAMARKAGFQWAFTVERGSNPFFYSDMHIRRSMVYGGYSLKEFENNLKNYDDRLMK